MPLGFNPHPEGILDNSPTFQRWVSEFRGAQVPEGRLKPREPSAVPSGLIVVPGPVPNVETLGYCRMSLRDNGSARVRIHLLGANPSGIARGRAHSASITASGLDNTAGESSLLACR